MTLSSKTELADWREIARQLIQKERAGVRRKRGGTASAKVRRAKGRQVSGFTRRSGG